MEKPVFWLLDRHAAMTKLGLSDTNQKTIRQKKAPPENPAVQILPLRQENPSRLPSLARQRCY